MPRKFSSYTPEQLERYWEKQKEFNKKWRLRKRAKAAGRTEHEQKRYESAQRGVRARNRKKREAEKEERKRLRELRRQQKAAEEAAKPPREPPQEPLEALPPVPRDPGKAATQETHKRRKERAAKAPSIRACEGIAVPWYWRKHASRAGWPVRRSADYWIWLHKFVLGKHSRLRVKDPLRAHGFTLDPRKVLRTLERHGMPLKSEQRIIDDAWTYLDILNTTLKDLENP